MSGYFKTVYLLKALDVNDRIRISELLNNNFDFVEGTRKQNRWQVKNKNQALNVFFISELEDYEKEENRFAVEDIIYSMTLDSSDSSVESREFINEFMKLIFEEFKKDTPPTSAHL